MMNTRKYRMCWQKVITSSNTVKSAAFPLRKLFLSSTKPAPVAVFYMPDGGLNQAISAKEPYKYDRRKNERRFP